MGRKPKHKYALVDRTTGATICTLADYQLDTDDDNEVILLAMGAASPNHKLEDTHFLARENYLMLRKLLKYYGLSVPD